MDLKRLDICDEILTALRHIIRAVELHSRRLVHDYGLTGPQLVLLKELLRWEELSVGDLAKKVSLSHATVTDILRRLEVRQLVQRSRTGHDRRRVLVHITEWGKRTAQNAPSLLQDRFVTELAKLQDWEQSLILSSVQRIASMMQAERLPTGPTLVGSSTGEVADGPIEPLDEKRAVTNAKKKHEATDRASAKKQPSTDCE